MKENKSALHSTYIIDGVQMKLTPAEILDACLPCAGERRQAKTDYAPIVDESTDPTPSAAKFDASRAGEYLKGIEGLAALREDCPMEYSDQYTRSRIAGALLDAIWRKGHFRLDDLSLYAEWKWNPGRLGNMAAFYSSAEAAADHIDSLGICLSGYAYSQSASLSRVTFKVKAAGRGREEVQDDSEEELLSPSPFGSESPSIGRSRLAPATIVPDPESWLIYIPFDSCDFRLGSSLLCRAYGNNGDTYPEIGDADYFIDCYEVVREFVEDKVVIAGASVGEGGLMAALDRMLPEGTQVLLDIGGIMSAYGEKDPVRVLFSEIPGALIQIRDIDYDYVDAELLLQDIVYYPIGHPRTGKGGIMLKTGGESGICGILQSLLNSQASEGED
ncbi:MAG: AIR synthase-related protein [Candidatus Cryptobacteroides sp.]